MGQTTSFSGQKDITINTTYTCTNVISVPLIPGPSGFRDPTNYWFNNSSVLTITPDLSTAPTYYHCEFNINPGSTGSGTLSISQSSTTINHQFDVRYFSNGFSGPVIYSSGMGAGSSFFLTVKNETTGSLNLNHSSYQFYGQKVAIHGGSVNKPIRFGGGGSVILTGSNYTNYNQITNLFVTTSTIVHFDVPFQSSNGSYLRKFGSGQIYLNADNRSYTGMLQVSQGTTHFNNPNCLGSQGIYLRRGNSATSGSIYNLTDKSVQDTLTNPSTSVPDTTSFDNSSGGPISIVANSTYPVVFWGEQNLTFQFLGSNDLQFNTNGVYVPSTFNLQVNSSNLTLNGNILGALAIVNEAATLSPTPGIFVLNKTGAGTLVLTGDNPCNSSLNQKINGGAFRIKKATGLGALASPLIYELGTGFLELDGSSASINTPANKSFLFNGGSGGIRSIAGSNTINGNITLGGFTSTIQTLSGSNLTMNSLFLTNNGTVDFNTAEGTNITFASNTTLPSTTKKSGLGTLSLTGTASVPRFTSTAGVSLFGPTISLSGILSVSASCLSLANLSTQTILSPTFAEGSSIFGSKLSSSNTYTITGNSVINSELSGSGGLTYAGGASGQLYLGSKNSYTGPTTINTGKVVVTNINSLSTGAVSIKAGATLQALSETDQKGRVFVSSLSFGNTSPTGLARHIIGGTVTPSLTQLATLTGNQYTSISQLPVIQTGKIVVSGTLSFSAPTSIYLENSTIYNGPGIYTLFDYSSGSFPGGQTAINTYLTVLVNVPGRTLFRAPYVDPAAKKIYIIIL